MANPGGPLKYISVSKTTPWAMAGPHWQLASLQLYTLAVAPIAQNQGNAMSSCHTRVLCMTQIGVELRSSHNRVPIYCWKSSQAQLFSKPWESRVTQTCIHGIRVHVMGATAHRCFWVQLNFPVIAFLELGNLALPLCSHYIINVVIIKMKGVQCGIAFNYWQINLETHSWRYWMQSAVQWCNLMNCMPI